MEIQYVYVKTRSQFGKQCFFDEFGPSIDENIATNPELTGDYITRNPCHVGVQKSKQYALHEIQTSDAVTKESGMFHTEGGWPKELNPKDEEATMRFRRRVEKDDNWAPKMNTLMEPVEHCVLQNNAVNIYENFFDDMVPTELVLPLAARTVNVYADPQLNVRPVTHLSWSPDHGKRLAVSYCLMEFQKSTNDLSSYSYIWDIENPNKAFMALKAFCPSVVIEFNPRDPSMLISGLMSGQVCNWDIRTGNVPVQVSELQYSHRDPANLALWINSKTNSEFFSASTCGTMKWWDIRKLREPTETLVLDLDNPLRSDEVRAIGVSALQFEATMGTKFMAGMENGTVISGSRKGKNPAEKLALRFRCHYGPVVAIDRNPFSTKNFLTVGDWTVKIWAEDTKEGCLISTIPRTTILNGGCWSTSRYSVFYVIDMSGQLEVYDLLVGMEGPVRTLRLCEDRLGAIAPHEEGKLVAVGSSKGNVYLVESSEAFTVNGKNDKALMTSYLDRCSRYEKAIDNRLKEVKLAQRIIFEEVLEPVLTRDRAKVKNKDKKEKVKKKEKDKDKGKEKDKGRFDIERKSSLKQKSRSKERTKEKSEEKDKKKSKSKRAKDGVTFPDDPELVTVELQYYETIQKEIEKYANIEDTEQEDPASKFESPGKRKKLEESRDKDARQKSDKDDQTKKIVILKKFADPHRESQDLTDHQDLDMVDDVNASVVLQESKEKIKSPGKASPGARKHSRRTKGFRLKEEKPCGTEVCQPTVCCLAKIDKPTTKKGKETSMDLDSHGRRNTQTLLIALPKALRKSVEDSDTKMKTLMGEKKQILRDKDAPPNILQAEVLSAREKLRAEVDRMKAVKGGFSTVKREKSLKSAREEGAEVDLLAEVQKDEESLQVQSEVSFEPEVSHSEAESEKPRKTTAIHDECELETAKISIGQIVGKPEGFRLPVVYRKIDFPKVKSSKRQDVYPRISAAVITKISTSHEYNETDTK